MASVEVEDFRNPEGVWEYQGAYAVDLKPDIDPRLLPDDLERRGTTLIVPDGLVIPHPSGGIACFKSSRWGFMTIYFGTRSRWIVAARRGDGTLIWENPEYR